MSAGDRKLLLGAGIVGLAMVIATVAFAPAPDQEGQFTTPSSYSSNSGGALAAYLLLQDLHLPVRRWEHPPAALPDSSSGSLLILADPTVPASKGERKKLFQFVEHGGRVLFCGGGISEFFPGPSTAPERSSLEWKEYPSNLPSAVTRQAPVIVLHPDVRWRELNPSQLALYGDPANPVAVSWRLGDGEILWWASATPLTNSGLPRGDNLRFFLNSIGGASDIYWDEYFHGQRGSLWAYVESTSIYWAIVQVLLISIAILFTFSRRSGPLSMPAVVSRLSPIEFVDTMGGLYQRAGASAIAVEVSYRQLRLKLARRLGLPSSISDDDLAQMAGERLGFRKEDLRNTLQSAAATSGNTKLPAFAALKLVQELEDYLARLENPKLQQEKY